MNLQAIKDRRAAITPGEWGVTRWAGGFSFNGPPVVYSGTSSIGEPYIITRPKSEEDAAFIANAPADIDALVKRVEDLEAECDHSALFHKPIEDLTREDLLERIRVFEMVEITQTLQTRIDELEALKTEQMLKNSVC